MSTAGVSGAGAQHVKAISSSGRVMSDASWADPVRRGYPETRALTTHKRGR